MRIRQSNLFHRHAHHAPRPENLFYALLKLQDKIDTLTLAKKPTEVRLDPNMVENFKRQVMIAQTLQPK